MTSTANNVMFIFKPQAMSYSDVAFQFKPCNKLEADMLIGWVMQEKLISSPADKPDQAAQLIAELDQFIRNVYDRI